MAARLCVLFMVAVGAAAGGTYKITWSNCDKTTHAQLNDLEPKTVTLGQKTTLTGTGAVDEVVAGGQYHMTVTAAGMSILDHTGDICKPDKITIKKAFLTLGTLSWHGFNCPVANGTTTMEMDVDMSANIPSWLASPTIKLTGTGSNGDKMLCVSINMNTQSEEVVVSPPPTIKKNAQFELEADVHPDRAAMLEEIRNTAGVLWKAKAHSRFAAEAPGASKDLCGVKGNHSKAIADGIARGEIEQLLPDADSPIPDSFDSEENWPHCAKIIGDIRDQSNCGCCWAFAGAEAASDRMCIASKGALMLPLSAQDVCFNANEDGCGGGQIDTPWSYIKRTGAVTGGQYKGTGPFGAGFCSDFSLPHCHHHGPQGDDPYPAEGKPGCLSQKSPEGPKKCDAAATGAHSNFASDKYSFDGQVISAQGEKGIQQMIMAGGPVETAFTVYSDFENYASGIYHHVKGQVAGGHAVKMVGWGVEKDVKYWKVANSWNPHWGEKGYFRIRRGNNECGIEDGVTGSSPSAKWSKGGDNAVVV